MRKLISDRDEPWLFTGTEVSNAYLLGMLAGLACFAPVWICLGIHLAEFASHGH